MTHYSDSIASACILNRTKVMAVVGVSANPVRPSYFVARYLKLKGFRVIPVNPAYQGTELFGETVLGALTEITAPVDMVDIFRKSEAVPAIVDEALATLPQLRTIWMQIGVVHAAAAAKAEAHGDHSHSEPVPQDRIPTAARRIAHGRVRTPGSFLQNCERGHSAPPPKGPPERTWPGLLQPRPHLTATDRPETPGHFQRVTIQRHLGAIGFIRYQGPRSCHRNSCHLRQRPCPR